MCKLTDFSKEELQTAFDMVVMRIADEDQHKKEWLRRFGNYDETDALYYDHKVRPIRGVNYEHLCLWRTQLLNAIGKVGVREEIESN